MLSLKKKKEKILLYDTQTWNYLETVSEYVITLVSQLYEPKNLTQLGKCIISIRNIKKICFIFAKSFERQKQ
jgi:hypothetical protein